MINQRQTIEMQQMASRPFSRIFLELFNPTSLKSGHVKLPTSDPTPIAFEPCFGDNIGLLSLFVQLPGGGRHNLAVGTALVNLNDTCDQDQPINSQLTANNSTDRDDDQDAVNDNDKENIHDDIETNDGTTDSLQGSSSTENSHERTVEQVAKQEAETETNQQQKHTVDKAVNA